MNASLWHSAAELPDQDDDCYELTDEELAAAKEAFDRLCAEEIDETARHRAFNEREAQEAAGWVNGEPPF